VVEDCGRILRFDSRIAQMVSVREFPGGLSA
jgi:hypothetical protein